MGWAARHIEKLRAGGTVSFRPRGNSMSGKIESGQLCLHLPRVNGPRHQKVVEQNFGERTVIAKPARHLYGRSAELLGFLSFSEHGVRPGQPGHDLATLVTVPHCHQR